MTSDKGEKGFLEAFGRFLHHGPPSAWRDDCVIVSLDDTTNLLYSIDRPEQIFSSGDDVRDMRLFGRWSAALVANDVIACGAQPRGISFDVGVSGLTTDLISVWAEGVLDVCRQYEMRYEGGNLGIGAGVSGVCWGTQNKAATLRRSGAVPGAILIATANIGTGWALKAWGSSGKDPSRVAHLAHYKDEPWVNLPAFREIWRNGGILSSMDLTDGIIEFGYEILEQDGLGVLFDPVVDDASIIDFVAHELSLPRNAFHFELGYDSPFAHGWCVERSALAAVRTVLAAYNVPVTVLGHTSSDLDGVFARVSPERIERLPRFWDDVFKPRGSLERWRKEIVPLFDHSRRPGA
jgi:thiamine monophosphate kinase